MSARSVCELQFGDGRNIPLLAQISFTDSAPIYYDLEIGYLCNWKAQIKKWDGGSIAVQKKVTYVTVLYRESKWAELFLALFKFNYDFMIKCMSLVHTTSFQELVAQC